MSRSNSSRTRVRLAAAVLAFAALVAALPILLLPTFHAASDMWLYDEAKGPVASETAAPEIEAWLRSGVIEQRMGNLRKHVTAEEISAGLRVEPMYGNHIQLRYDSPHPIIATWIVNEYSDVTAELLPMSVNLHAADPTPDLSAAKPGDGWLLLSALTALVCAVLVLLGLGESRLPERQQWWVFFGLALALLVAVLVRTAPTSGLLAAGTLAALGLTVGWRSLLAAAVLGSSIRHGTFDALFPGSGWAIAQLAPLALAGLSLFLPRLRLPRRPREEWVVLGLLAAFVVITGLLSFGSELPRRSLTQTAVLAAFMGWFAGVHLLRWTTRARILGDLATLATTVTVGIAVCFGLMAFTPMRWPLSTSSGRYQFLWQNPNLVAVLIAVLIAVGVASLSRTSRVLFADTTRLRLAWGAALIVLTPALLLTGSRGALVAVVVATAAELLTMATRRRLLLVSPVLAVGFLVAGIVGTRMRLFHREGATGIDSGRIALWAEAMQRFAADPLTGVGFRVGTSQGPSVTYHNLYVTLLTELGLVGVAALLAWLVGMAWLARGGRPMLVAAAAAIAVAELFESDLIGFVGPTALTGWLVLFAWAALGCRRREEKHAAEAGTGASVAPAATA